MRIMRAMAIFPSVLSNSDRVRIGGVSRWYMTNGNLVFIRTRSVADESGHPHGNEGQCDRRTNKQGYLW